MIGLLSRCVLFAACIYVITAQNGIQPPPCDQIAQNAAMCTFERFKRQCPRECGNFSPPSGNAGTVVTANNHDSGSNERNSNSVNSQNQGARKGKSSEVTTTVAAQTTQRPTVTSSSGITTSARSRARSGGKSQESNRGSSGTKNCNRIDPCVDAATANAGFRSRCQAAGIAESCQEKCRYDITFDEMKKAMLSKQCPMGGMREFLVAGANNQDNRQCCEQTGVLEGKRAFCHPFCNPHGNEWPTRQEAAKYLPCASQLNAIMRCHWASVTQ